MDETTSTLFYSMASPCYQRTHLVISELSEGMYILFRNRIWSMLVYVKKVLGRSSGRHAHLLIDIKMSSGCALPPLSDGVYLYGANKQKGNGEEVSLYLTPFLTVGEGMSLSDDTTEQVLGGKSLFYELGTMFVLDFSSLC